MTKQEIRNRIVFRLTSYYGIEESDINDSKTFLKNSRWSDFAFDSLDVVELIMYAESEFSIQISDDDVEKLDTINALVEYIFKKV